MTNYVGNGRTSRASLQAGGNPYKALRSGDAPKCRLYRWVAPLFRDGLFTICSVGIKSHPWRISALRSYVRDDLLFCRRMSGYGRKIHETVSLSLCLSFTLQLCLLCQSIRRSRRFL